MILSPYCGAPPDPGGLIGRFNIDPVLILVLVALTLVHLRTVAPSAELRRRALAGWLVAAVAFLSPLCALSVSLFAARVGQHMLLILVAAPLLAAGLPVSRIRPFPASLAFFLALWFWHMPAPYAATFGSTPVYWSMHISLLASAVALWAALLHAPPERAGQALAAGFASSLHMGFLGALLALAGRPMFAPHYLTTFAWGLTPIEDQQLGGVLMWVPGIFLFLWVAMRSTRLGWSALERRHA